MTWLLLARHGETAWNTEGRWQGHADIELNDRGREQARALAEQLAGEPIDVIYASDLRRAHDTALIIAARKQLPVAVDTGLREVDVGSWSGHTRDEIARKFPAMATHDGETDEQHLARVLATFARIATAHRDQRILIVSHGKTLRVARGHALGALAPVLGNCETVRMRFIADRLIDGS